MNAKIILDNIPIPILVFDLQENILLYANAPFCALADMPVRDMAGKPIETINEFFPEVECKAIIRKVYEFSEHDSEVVRFIKSKSMVKYVCKIKTIIQDEFAYSMCTFENQKQESLDRQLLLAPRPKLALAPGIDHELRTSLTALVGLSQLLIDEEETSKIRFFAEDILQSSLSVQKILNSDAVYAPETQPVVVPDGPRTEIVECIRHSIYKFSPRVQEKGLHLSFATFQKEIFLELEELKFTEVFDIFTGNAIESTSSGDVKIDVFKKVSGTRKQIVLKIVDSGIGIKKPRLDLFQRQKREGLVDPDLELFPGFWRANRLLQQMSADIQVESQYGVGTTCFITFPLRAEETNAEERPGSGAQSDFPELRLHDITSPRGGKPDVLIVDDDQIVFQLLKIFIGSVCTLDYAIDGRRAMAAIGKKRYDLIFMDINLGVGLTGLQVVKKIRRIKEYVRTPIVALTAFAMPGDMDKALDSGCTFYQSKPFTKEDIIAIYNKCMNVYRAPEFMA
jgi:CheY-like chemotaxis protein